MRQQDDSNTAKLLRGLVAGAIAGAVASFAMDRFQAGVTVLTTSGKGDDDDEQAAEPATQKAADAVARQVTGSEIARADKPLAGQTVHYALGIGLGIAYGIAAEYRPAVTAGYGTTFGLVTATLLDEGLVPAVGLGEVAWNTDLTTNIYSYVSHLVFGGTSELVRRQVASTLVT